jgi:hypothetical protein
MVVTVRINLAYVLAVLGALLAAVIALQVPEIRRYLKMETM